MPWVYSKCICICLLNTDKLMEMIYQGAVVEQRTILHSCRENVTPDKLRNSIKFGNRRKNVENFPKTRLKPLFPVPFFYSGMLKKP